MNALMFPIGPILSYLGKWFRENREKLTRDSRNPLIKSDLTTFGFTDKDSLPLPENEAVALAAERISESDFETAKHMLINAWIMTPDGIAGEPAFQRLRQGFVDLYIAKGDTQRAERISQMPTMLLDKEVQWIVTHQDAQIGGSALDEEKEPDQKDET